VTGLMALCAVSGVSVVEEGESFNRWVSFILPLLRRDRSDGALRCEWGKCSGRRGELQ
jgi:hypothetical protein